MTEPTPRTLIERLREAGQIGLDLSPGDPLCQEAAEVLARRDALLREIHAALGWRQKNMKERIERELEGKS
jgi:hypothetical protein